MSGLDGFVTTLLEELSRLHAEFVRAVEDLDDGALAWCPGPDTNSISTIVIHALGSEAEVVRLAAGLPAPRDRASEFEAAPEGPHDLMARIEDVNQLLEDLGPALAQANLLRTFTRPSAVRNREPRPGIFWLLNGYGHTREHLAQIQLTRQMYDHAVGGAG